MNIKNVLLTKLITYVAIIIAIITATYIINYVWRLEIAGTTSQLITTIRNALFSIGLIVFFREYVPGLKASFRHYLLAIPSIVLVSLVVMHSYYQVKMFNISYSGFSLHILKAISVAVWEELFFRYYIFVIFLFYFSDKISLFRIAMLSSMLFAVLHFINLFNPDVFKLSVIIQVVFAFGIGLLLQSIFIRTRSLFIVIALHFTINVMGTRKIYFERISGIVAETQENYSINEFITSLGLTALIVGLIMIPASYALMPRKEITSQLFTIKKLDDIGRLDG